MNNAPGYGAEKMDTYFDPLVLRLIDLLQQALPDAQAEDLFWSFQFTSGAYSLILSRTGRIDRLSDNLCRSDDFEAVRERFVTFMAGGFDALYKHRKATAGRATVIPDKRAAPVRDRHVNACSAVPDNGFAVSGMTALGGFRPPLPPASPPARRPGAPCRPRRARARW